MTDAELLAAISGLFSKELTPIKEDIKEIKKDISGLKEDVNVLKEDVSGLKEDVSVLKEDVSGLKEDVSVLKDDVNVLKDDVDDLNKRVKTIELTLETVTNRNIRIIAEGHENLNRRLDEALKVESEKEMLLIRVNILEKDMREVKDKIAQSA